MKVSPNFLESHNYLSNEKVFEETFMFSEQQKIF